MVSKLRNLSSTWTGIQHKEEESYKLLVLKQPSMLQIKAPYSPMVKTNKPHQKIWTSKVKKEIPKTNKPSLQSIILEKTSTL